MKTTLTQNYCADCQQETNHEIVGLSEIKGDENYNFLTEYKIVKCCGCNKTSFTKEFHDYENAFQISETEWDYTHEVEIFPKKKKGNLTLGIFSNAPQIIEDIYDESCNAFANGSHTLAGIGFRAVLEAVCNDQKILGKELLTRINNLSVKGLISKRDSTRLHSIRFLGNDAAHDTIKPSASTLDAALTIIEHLINTIYIIDYKTKGKLEEIIDDYELFELMLSKKLEEFSPGDDFPLLKFFGKDIRLLSGSTKLLERRLLAEIGKKKFTKLNIGVKKKFFNSEKEFQHFIVS